MQKPLLSFSFTSLAVVSALLLVLSNVENVSGLECFKCCYGKRCSGLSGGSGATCKAACKAECFLRSQHPDCESDESEEHQEDQKSKRPPPQDEDFHDDDHDYDDQVKDKQDNQPRRNKNGKKGNQTARPGRFNSKEEYYDDHTTQNPLKDVQNATSTTTTEKPKTKKIKKKKNKSRYKFDFYNWPTNL